MACKCGSRRKKGSQDFVIILFKELNRNIKRTLTGLGSSPIFLETAESFCKVPARSWYQFSTFGFNPFNKIIDERWARNCECNPEKGSWTVKVRWSGKGYDVNGNLQGEVKNGLYTVDTSRFPYNLAVVSVAISAVSRDIRLLVQPPIEAPYFLGNIVSGTNNRFFEVIEGIEVIAKPTVCYPGNPPTPVNGGNYPDVPSPPFPAPPPSFFIPSDPPPPPKKIPIIPPPPPPPPDECCDCC